MNTIRWPVSDACQIKDLDHSLCALGGISVVSDACQIKDLDHSRPNTASRSCVSDACQIKDLDHSVNIDGNTTAFQMPVRSKT